MERSTDAAAVKCSSPTMSAVAAIALARSAARPACFSCICRPKPMSAANRRLGETTIAYYDRFARAFWDGTRHHDVSQNYAAFLKAIERDPPYSILDLGCGPGRDLSHFRSLGHEAIGLDGSRQFVAMARTHSGCEVLHRPSNRRIPRSATANVPQRSSGADSGVSADGIKTRALSPEMCRNPSR